MPYRNKLTPLIYNIDIMQSFLLEYFKSQTNTVLYIAN